MSFGSDARKAAVLLLGLLNAAASGFFLYRVTDAKPIDVHLVRYGLGWLFISGLFIAPRHLFDAAKKVKELLPSVKIGQP